MAVMHAQKLGMNESATDVIVITDTRDIYNWTLNVNKQLLIFKDNYPESFLGWWYLVICIPMVRFPHVVYDSIGSLFSGRKRFEVERLRFGCALIKPEGFGACLLLLCFPPCC